MQQKDKTVMTEAQAIAESEVPQAAPQADPAMPGLDEATVLALRTIVREELSALVEAGQTPPQDVDQEAPDAHTESLAQQALWLQEVTGVDMLELLRGDSALMDLVAAGQLDLYQAYIQHGQSAPSGSALPPPIRGGSGRARVDVGRLSPEKMRELEERLGRGERIAID